MKVHFIAIGGSAMHNLAIELQSQGHIVTGSDDEIYEPSLSKLKAAGISPEEFGWFPDKISTDIEVIVLGMHARKDNPELLRALDLGVNVVSYPEFIFQQSKDKKRIVVAGSHGKTTTTSMIIHVLTKAGVSADYMVGAQVDGFDRMVKLTNNNIIVLEGDEYLSSPIDSRSKFSHYQPHLTVITGVSWDHVNVFPQEIDYVNRFYDFIDSHSEESKIFYFGDDKFLKTKFEKNPPPCTYYSYNGLVVDNFKNIVLDGKTFPYKLIGQHNLQNAHAAYLVCKELGVSDDAFFESLSTFKGASKRLQKVFENNGNIGFLDFAHAPSKVKATTTAVKEWYPSKNIVAVLELHTFSSLNQNFIPQYKSTLSSADQAIVFYDQHTLEMKRMPALPVDFVKDQFDHPNLLVFDNKEQFHEYLSKLNVENSIILLMTSGNFGNFDLNKLNKW